MNTDKDCHNPVADCCRGSDKIRQDSLRRRRVRVKIPVEGNAHVEGQSELIFPIKLISDLRWRHTSLAAGNGSKAQGDWAGLGGITWKVNVEDVGTRAKLG